MPEQPDKNPPNKPTGPRKETELPRSGGSEPKTEAEEVGDQERSNPQGSRNGHGARATAEPEKDAQHPNEEDENDVELQAPLGATVVLDSGDIIVFVENGRIGTHRTEEYGDYPLGALAIWTDVKTAEAQPSENLTKSAHHTYLVLVACAFASVAEKDGTAVSANPAYEASRLDGARRLLREAESLRSRRLAEVSRVWLLQCSLVWCLVWLTVGLYAWLYREGVVWLMGGYIPTAVNCTVFGAVGAFLSVCLRLDQVVTTPESGRHLHWAEAGVRITIGGMAALAVYLAFETGIILKGIATNQQLLLTYLVALVAGLSERALPALAAQVPGGLGKDLGKNSNAAAG